MQHYNVNFDKVNIKFINKIKYIYIRKVEL